MPSTTVNSDGQGYTTSSTSSTTIELHPTSSNALGVDTQTHPGNGDYLMVRSDRTVCTDVALTGSWVWTLPAASSVPRGWEIVASDHFGVCSLTYRITVNMTSGDTINGTAAYAKELKSPYAFFRFRSDGVSNWQIVGQFPVAGTPVGDAAYTILSTDTYVYTTTAFTGQHTWTLPTATSVGTGWEITVSDAVGGISPAAILRVIASGADTIHPSTSGTYYDMFYPYSYLRVRSDGVSNWQVLGAAVSDVSGTGSAHAPLGQSGWMADSGSTWTFVSASSFSTANPYAQQYLTKGTKVSWTDSGGVKYGVVAATPTLSGGIYTVTLIVNADYSVANSTITSPLYSYAASPQGFPTWFNWTPTTSGWTTTPTFVCRWKTDGRSITLSFITFNATSNNAAHTLTLPATAATVTNMVWVNPCNGIDNGVVQNGVVSVNSAGTVLNCYGIATQTNTAAGNSRHFGQLVYEF